MAEYAIAYAMVMVLFALALYSTLKIARDMGEGAGITDKQMSVSLVIMAVLWPIVLPVLVFIMAKAYKDSR